MRRNQKFIILASILIVGSLLSFVLVADPKTQNPNVAIIPPIPMLEIPSKSKENSIIPEEKPQQKENNTEFCGNNICDPKSEDCSTCERDCGQCSSSSIEPIRIATAVGIVWLVEGNTIPNCSIPCYFEREGHSPEYLQNMDAVVYGEPQHYLHYYDPNKVNIYAHSESTKLYAKLREPYRDIGSKYDMVVSYHQLEDDVMELIPKNRTFRHLMWSYSPVRIDHYYRDDFFVPFKDKQDDATVFISNCGIENSARLDLLRDLTKYIPIKSFGRCLPNAVESEIEDCQNLTHYDQKLCILKKFKFYLSFENAVEDSWVTEKYFHALLARTIPIFLGASNVDDFSPTDDLKSNPITIKVSDFHSVEKLAQYIKKVGSDEELYNTYLNWRKQPPAQHFKEILQYSLDFPETICKMCEMVKEIKDEKKIKKIM